jgi:hypothetical protein
MFWWSWSDVNVTGGGAAAWAIAMLFVIPQIAERRQINAGCRETVTKKLQSVML